MNRCLSVPLSARTSEELVGYLDRLHACQQRLAALQAAVVRELTTAVARQAGDAAADHHRRPGRNRHC